MLARKYRAMRNSGGGHNKTAAAPSSSFRLNKLRRSCNTSSNGDNPVFKRLPESSQGQYITEKRIKQSICNGDTKGVPEDNKCANREHFYSSVSGSKKNTIVCNVTKDLSTPTQGNYIENSLPAKCVLNEPKKPMIKNTSRCGC